MEAADEGNEQMVRMLLDAGAAADSRDAKRGTAQMLATVKGHQRNCAILSPGIEPPSVARRQDGD